MEPVQCKMARAALSLGVRELAELALVAPATISRLEAGEPLKPRTIAAIQSALESQGIEFIPANASSATGGPGIRIRSSD